MTKSGAHSPPSHHLSLSSPVSSPEALISAIPGTSSKLKAATAKVYLFHQSLSPMLFPVFPSSIRHLLRLDWALSYSVQLAIPTPNSTGIDPDLAAEFDAFRLLVPETYRLYMDAFSRCKGITLPPCRPCEPQDRSRGWHLAPIWTHLLGAQSKQ